MGFNFNQRVRAFASAAAIDCLVIDDFGKIVLGETSGGADGVTYPTIEMIFTAGAAILHGELLDLQDDGAGNPVVEPVLETSATNHNPVIGFAQEDAAMGAKVHVAVKATYTGFYESAASTAVTLVQNEPMRRSATEDGRVERLAASTSVGMMGHAMQDVLPDELFKGYFLRAHTA
jgi:hypothetical protein